MTTPAKQAEPQDKPIVAKIDRMPEPTAFEIATAKKSKEGLDLEVHVLAELATLQSWALVHQSRRGRNVAVNV